MRAPAQYSTHQGSYSQQYQFYYDSKGRYCAYDPYSRTHLIHSLKSNRWCLYYPDRVSPTQQYPKPKSRRHNVTAEHQQYENDYQHEHPHNDQYMWGERGREQVRRSHREYPAAAKEAAHQSIIDESNIDMDYNSEDEGVDVDMYERNGRSRRRFKDSRRQQSRSGAEPRNEKAYTREASRPRESNHQSMHYTNYHTYQCHHGCIHPNQTHGYQAGVGYEGSDHDSGLGGESIPEPRKTMPRVARWLDETASVYHPMEDNRDHFDTEHTTREETSYPHRSEVRVKHNSQKPHHTEKPTRDRSHQRSWSPSKRLHRQDSGICMTEPMHIEIDIQVDDVPRQRYTSQSPSRSSMPNSSSQTNVQCEYDCYYDCPPCPDLPPTPDGAVILVSRSQELAAPRSIHQAAPAFCQADSIYCPSILAPRPSHPFHEAYSSPSKLPRAPSPPLSPPPARTRRSGERRYPRF